VLIRLGHGGDQLAARAKNLKRTYLRLASDEIEYRIDILHLILEALCVIIQYLVGTEDRTYWISLVPAVAIERRRARRVSWTA